MTGYLTTRRQGAGGGPDLRPDALTRILEALIIVEVVVVLALVGVYIVMAIA